MKVLHCIIIENEPSAQRMLQQYTEKINFLSLKSTFTTVEEGLKYVKKNKVDLIFLNVDLPQLEKIAFASIVSKNQKLILTSNDYLDKLPKVEGIIDYILKPITFKRFMHVMLLLEQVINNEAPSPKKSVKAELPKPKAIKTVKTSRIKSKT